VSVSKRTLERGEAEIKARRRSDAFFVPITDAAEAVKSLLAELSAEDRGISE
jgi:hypothetical protein